MSDLRIGLVLPTREAAMAGHPSAEPLLQMAERAEAAGFDSVWAGDAPFARPRFEPLTLLAGVAARTRTITVGTGIILPALRQPLLLAHAVATVDRIAEGRLVLGIGTGWIREEFEAVEARFDQRVGRMVEAIGICREMWRAASAENPSPVTFSGRYWSFDDIRLFPPPHRPEGPPVWMGGSSEGAIRRAARLFDGWFPTAPTPDEFAEGWARVQAAAGEAGRADDELVPAVYLSLNLGPNAEEETRTYAQEYYGLPFEVMRQAQAYYVGDSGGCAEWLAGFRDAGARHLVIRFTTLDALPQMELVAEKILPALRD